MYKQRFLFTGVSSSVILQTDFELFVLLGIYLTTPIPALTNARLLPSELLQAPLRSSFSPSTSSSSFSSILGPCHLIFVGFLVGVVVFGSSAPVVGFPSRPLIRGGGKGAFGLHQYPKVATNSWFALFTLFFRIY